MPKTFVVYILSNESRQLYVGVTSRLAVRLQQHRTGATPGYASARRVDRLVYVEVAPNAAAAITREKHLKGYRRGRKLRLVDGANPEWRDLSLELGIGGGSAPSLRSG